LYTVAEGKALQQLFLAFRVAHGVCVCLSAKLGVDVCAAQDFFGFLAVFFTGQEGFDIFAGQEVLDFFLSAQSDFAES